MDLIERTIQVSWQHRVLFTEHVFDPANSTLRNNLSRDEQGSPRRALVVVDESLSVAQPSLSAGIENYFSAQPDGSKHHGLRFPKSTRQLIVTILIVTRISSRWVAARC